MKLKSIPYLRTHSYFSFLQSLCSPKDLVNAASRYKLQTLGLTDHRYLSGAVEFYEACKNRQINPIIGLEVDISYKGFHGLLTLFAKDINGWSNLSRLSSLMLVEENLLDITTLNDHQRGLICTCGDAQGVLRKLIHNESAIEKLPDLFLSDLSSIFEEDIFVEIQRYTNGPMKYEQNLLTLNKRHGLPIIATQKILYENKSQQAAYRTLTAIKHNTSIHSLHKQHLPPGSAHFPSPKEFNFRFKDIPEALENLKVIEDRCHLILPVGQTHYPRFPTPKGKSQSDYLREKAFQGAREHYHNLTPTITQRLNYELGIISNMGYDPIFLIVEDIINHARKLSIPTSSRGSAASSLVAHCLKITSPDPLALNLYFERFLNPARKKPPDIDTDIASHRRDEIIHYVFEKYGMDRVAMVATINHYRPKSALGDVAKAYGLSPETIRQLSKKLPSSFRFQRGDDSSNPFSQLSRDGSIPIIKDIINDAQVILGIPRHLSVHPGGIIIAPFPITDLIPLIHSPSLNINHAQFDLEGIEKLGMVKIDLLGIRGLTVLGEVANKIQSWRCKEFKSGLDVLEKIPKEDSDTARTISEAKTIGCFQIESPGMRETLREINAKNVEDIMAALALYRPGPLRGGLRDAFIRRFRGEEPVTHIHKSLSNLLDNTLGVILYQEQVLRIAHELGELTIAQADILRRAMSHFDPGGVMVTLRQNFITGAAFRHNVPAETAERIWDMMAAFAEYGFPKAHAASYAQLAWNSAWCKTHYPAEFIAAVLGFGGGYYSQRVYLMEARRLKLKLTHPHVNYSNHRFSVRYPKGEPILYMGFNQVRGLTRHTIEAIIHKRPFHTLEEFLIRVNPQKKEAQNLIMCGAFDGLTTIPLGLKQITQTRPPGQMQLFLDPNQTEDWNMQQRLKAQQEILGVSLTITPLEQFTEQIQSAGAVTTLEAQSLIGEKVRVAGMRQTLRRFRTRTNQMMCYLTLEDLEGSLRVMIPPQVYKKHYIALRESDLFLIEGVMEQATDQKRIRMIAGKVTSLSFS
ncbi:MAG: DNA polymerase III subunit alpha [Chloroflexota bacterium]|nr:DNA polymerase III subunit alpha [Chloroflexota bacterium]